MDQRQLQKFTTGSITFVCSLMAPNADQAKSFHATTGSIGGSQGINWQARDGTRMAAYLSFSDLLTEYGSEQIFGKLAPASEKFKPDSPAESSFMCRTDPATYRLSPDGT